MIRLPLKKEFTISDLSGMIDDLRSFAGKDDVLIDASLTEKVDIAGLQLLLSVKKECLRMGKSFEIIASKPLLNLMSFSGVNIL